jgi:hypothetical protein
MKNTFKLKAIQRIAGIIALLAIIVFSMAACSGDDWFYSSNYKNWPKWEEDRLYFKVTNDKHTMLLNPAGSSGGPGIYKVLPEGKGNFPVGKWICSINKDTVINATVIFTDTTFTRYFGGKTIIYKYTISGDYFLFTLPATIY